jgi:hypothetical protein
VHRVHVSVDRLGVLGPPWTDVGADRGHGGAVTRAWPPAAPVRQSGEGSEVRCGDGRGCSSPFIGAGGAPGRGGQELIAGVNGFNAIEGVKVR